MTDGRSRTAQERRIGELDAALAAAPESTDLLYRRAGLLAQLGRGDEAKRDFLAVLARAPGHFGALNDLGTLLYRSGYRTAARLAYAEAVRHHPDQAVGRINLGNALLEDGQTDAAREQYEAALQLAPDHADAHQGMANLLHLLGQDDAAERHRQRGCRGRTVITQPYRGAGPPCRVLLLVSARGGNIPTGALLDDRVFLTSILAVESHVPTLALPAHDLVFNAIGDADLCAPALGLALDVLARSTAPVINHPDAVRLTGRAANAQRLAGLPGLVVPRTVTVPRTALTAVSAAALAARHGLAFPLLLRSPGFHTGRYFQRVEDAAGLAAAAAELPGRELILIEYLDAQGADGKTRKYRAMMIAGGIYPLHLAVSNDWKVHYFTADMERRPDYRAEEAEFLADMPSVIGPRAMAALEAVRGALGLDYAGIDFGLAPAGDLLLFEANATMVVNPPAEDECWAYRRAPVERILAATRAMLIGRARPAGHSGP